MQNFFNKVKESFIKSTNGEEDLKILIRYWGVLAYIFTYLVLNKIIITYHNAIITQAIALVCIIYFSWHLYSMIKCSPKKPKLTKEQKKELRQAKRKEFFKNFWKKLTLQESFGKWDPIFVTKLIDIFCIANFFGLFLD